MSLFVLTRHKYKYIKWQNHNAENVTKHISTITIPQHHNILQIQNKTTQHFLETERMYVLQTTITDSNILLILLIVNITPHFGDKYSHIYCT